MKFVLRLGTRYAKKRTVVVMMQAQRNALHANEMECIQAVVENEGCLGFSYRGLGPILAREVPSYAIGFLVYGVLVESSMAESFGNSSLKISCL